MKTEGIAPNIITYSAAISACEKSGQVEKCLDLLDEMKADGVVPDVIAYWTIIHACEEGGQADKAVHLRAEMMAAGFALDSSGLLCIRSGNLLLLTEVETLAKVVVCLIVVVL